MVQNTFQRIEMKYLLTREQKERIAAAMAPFMKPDPYGQTVIRNVYFDTPDFRLVRQSNEKPVYKEKLRIRSYARATAESTVFIELKKKYESIVYKRRMPLPEKDAMRWAEEGGAPPADSQIAKEIAYFLSYYKTLEPKVFLSYEREAFFGREDEGFRITFDEDILYRQTDLSLRALPCGERLVEEGAVLMEVKCSGGLPLWLTKLLSEEKLYKTTFSKYGEAYRRIRNKEEDPSYA